MEKRLFIPQRDPLEGLFGVFDDSLPDGWGRLLVDRTLQKQGISPTSVGALERLAIVGSSGMGALCYEPAFPLLDGVPLKSDLDTLAQEVKLVLEASESKILDELFMLGGSSGGARPKILTRVEGEDWMIKFPSSVDPPTIGSQEHRYALCAKECGIAMPEVRLFPSKIGDGYFGVRRFDRKSPQERIHMVSAAGLLETSHRISNLDYIHLMKLTHILTDSMEEVKNIFRLMCFNVFAHNRDDHGKNFSFLFKGDTWQLSPAYDLTYSSSIGGEHATTIAGESKNPGIKNILEVAKQAGISQMWARQTAEEVEEKTRSLL